jgi:hypothetical protein
MYTMKTASAYVLETFLLFEAYLLQYANALTTTSTNNLSITNAGCTGCTISAGPTVLTYPSPVSNVVQTVTATVIPYITEYDNTNITSYSTIYQYASGVNGQSANTSPTTTSLIWSTLGTTLTYPTTYLAFPSPVAGVSKSFSGTNSFCYASLNAITLDATDQAHLIFASSTPADYDRITASVVSLLDTLPSISAAVSPYQPSQCSPFAGTSQVPAAGPTTTAAVNGPESSASTPLAVTHTTVQFLITQGQPVITRSAGTAQPQINTPLEITNGGGSAYGLGGSTSTPTPTPKPAVITVGGTTITAGPSGAFTVGGQTLAPGGTAVVVGGTTISLAAGGSTAVVNGQTSTLAGATGTATTSTSASLQSAGSDASVRVWISGTAIGTLGLLVGLFL